MQRAIRGLGQANLNGGLSNHEETLCSDDHIRDRCCDGASSVRGGEETKERNRFDHDHYCSPRQALEEKGFDQRQEDGAGRPDPCKIAVGKCHPKPETRLAGFVQVQSLCNPRALLAGGFYLVVFAKISSSHFRLNRLGGCARLSTTPSLCMEVNHTREQPNRGHPGAVDGHKFGISTPPRATHPIRCAA